MLSLALFEVKTNLNRNTSKHLKGCSVTRVRHFFWHTKDFVIFLFPDSFRIQRILPFSCFWTLSVFKGFCPFPVSRHFPYSRDFVVSLFPNTFRIQGILLFPCFLTLSVFKGFCRFSCLETLSGFKSV